MGLNGLLMHLILLGAILAPVASQPKPGCSASCGNLTIPFPFGTTSDCYLDDSFLITCNNSYSPPKPFLRKSKTLQVLNISLDGHMRITAPVARNCYKKSGLVVNKNDTEKGLWLLKFFFSSTRNKFTAVGCDTVAVVHGSKGQNYTSGCVALCGRVGSVVNGSCSGAGCCQTSIPPQARDFNILVDTINNHSQVWDFNPCGYGFVVEEEAFSFSSLDLMDLQGRETVPVVLDWAVGNETCQEAQNNLSSYACRAIRGECTNSSNGPGYLCSCASGYQGNPYIVDGCQDINECEVSNPCNGTCTNLPGNFSCSCPKGYEGDGTRNGTGCHHKGHSIGSTLLTVALGTATSITVLLVGFSWLYLGIKKRNLIRLKEKFFREHGGVMLQQQLSVREGSAEMAKIFTAEELEKATDNYDENRIIGRGGYGTVYEGVLADNRTVAIKKSKIVDQSQIEQFINEVIVLSQINHRNVVKLLGCCLETEVPLLVYEFIPNGTLFDHLHNKSKASSISWEVRMRIAAETAGVLAYLHSAASIPIIHRDVKSTNILLDDNYTAKVSDFGASRLVPLDDMRVSTMVQGTLGYLDPEYLLTSQLTEKSDVYSFGVVLVELLTGKKVRCFDRPEEERNLAMYFLASLKKDNLFQILEDCIVQEGSVDQLKEVANLAKRCLRVKGEERPTMKDVAIELEGLRMMVNHSWVINDDSEETEFLLGDASDAYGFEGGSKTTTGCDSTRENMILPLDGGR